MKFIYITDVHIKGISPSRRKDVFYASMLAKLTEVGEIIKNNNINFVVIGGDLFDLPKVSNQILSQIAEIMKAWGVKIFVVPGNHDLYGQNIATLQHTSLGVLVKTGVVRLLTRDTSPLYFGKHGDPNSPLVAITGQEYYADIDTGVNDDYGVTVTVADYHILAIHAMLVQKPFHPDVAHTVIDNVLTDADMVLSGHYHPERFDKTVSGTRFIKPRSMARLEATKHNMTTLPEYAVVEVTKNNGVVSSDVTFGTFLSAKNGADIFDYDAAAEAKLYKNDLNAFKDKINSVDLTEAVDLPSMIKTVAQTVPDVEYVHIERALKQLISSEKANDEANLNGYLPSIDNIQIDQITIENFQSHEMTIVDFERNALNAFVGESNNGKTAVIRALEWVLYNEPKGVDYIRDGASYVKVEIRMTNGNIITRRRTNSDSGYYEIFDAMTGTTTKYSKFSHNVPMEVYNAHQMPKILVGKENVSFNVSKQLDGPFMLSMSANERATLLGKITRTDIIDNAILEVSKNITNSQRTVKDLEKERDSITQSIASMQWINDEGKRIELAESLILNLDKLKAEKLRLENLLSQFTHTRVELAAAQFEVNKYNNIGDAELIIRAIDSDKKLMDTYRSLKSNLESVESDLSVENQIHDSINIPTDINEVVAEMESNNAKKVALTNIKNSLDGVLAQLKREQSVADSVPALDSAMIVTIEDDIKEYHKLLDKVNEHRHYAANLEKVENHIGQEKAFIEKSDLELENLQKEYQRTLKEVGTCPVCQNKLSDDKISCLTL